MSSVMIFFTKIAEIPIRVGELSGASQQIQLVQGDTGPKLRFTLKDCEGNLITDGISGVNFYIKQFCSEACTNEGHTAVSGVNVSGGLWQYCLQPGDVSAAGTYFGDVSITYDSGIIETGFDAVRMLVRKANCH